MNHNYIPDTRHKVATSLVNGIPISPGEVITANSDVIIGKPGKMGPRPPQTFSKGNENIGMKPPPLPIPNVPVHPVLEVLEETNVDSKNQPISDFENYKVSQIQIVPAHQVYEEHQQVPISIKPQKLHPIQKVSSIRFSSKHDILKNDPLLKPPDRIGVEKHGDLGVDLKPPGEWESSDLEKHWNEKEPPKTLVPPFQFDEV